MTLNSNGFDVRMKRSANHSEQKNENIIQNVKIDTIPKFSDLKAKVDAVVTTSTWWDMYGVDWAVLGIFTSLLPLALLLLKSDSLLYWSVGLFLLGWIHHVFGTKAGHMALHSGLTQNIYWHRYFSTFFVEFCGSASESFAYDSHVKKHHPYTNIIGLGDSTIWKVPCLPRYIYMFIAPMLIPIATIVVSITGLMKKRQFLSLLKYLIVASLGLASVVVMLMKICNYSLCGALLVVWASRAILSISFIHMNIFQHIGLPMWSEKSKPVRLFQMSSAALNLPRNPILDYAFGHSLVSCHIEHHLFPRLSDNMCLKIKPIVSKFLKENGMPYNEKTYMNRLSLFLDKYDTLMVNAPPITHFVGIQ